MYDFLNYDFDIKNICGAFYVRENRGTKNHQNRKSHGIAFNLGTPKTYIFENDTKVFVRQNEFIYMPKHSNYVVESNPSGNCFAVNFELYTEKTFAPFSFKVKNASLYIQKLKTLESIWIKKKKTYQMDCKAILYEILSEMEREYESKYLSSSTKELISPAIKYIHNHYTDTDFTINDLARMCNISQDYLRKLFMQTYRVSPLKYINHLRITHAEELITSGIYGVSEAGMLSGYSDASYFSREFKKHYGVSPINYLKEVTK